MTITKTALLIALLTSTGASLAGTGDPNRGREVFMQRCAMCHGQDGRGNNGMAVNFREEWHRLTKSDEALMANIRNGLRTPGKSYSAGMMPPQVLSERQLQDVLAFLKQSFLH